MQQEQTAKNTHFHVMAGFHGCLPEECNDFTDRETAIENLKQIIESLKDGGNKLEGTILDGYFEVTKKTDALCDYVEMVECTEDYCYPKEE